MWKRLLPLPILLCAAAPPPVLMTVMARPISPPGYEPAPMPDAEAKEPLGLVRRATTRLNPTIFSTAKTQYRGDGFVSDSSEQVSEQRNFRPAGGTWATTIQPSPWRTRHAASTSTRNWISRSGLGR